MPPRPRSVSSVERALTIVCLLRDRGRVRVQEVADELGVAPSTAHRLLSALRESGFAEQGPGRVYQRGPELGWASPRREQPDLVDAARPHLAALASEVGETAHLMVLEGASARFVDGAEGAHAVRVATRVGIVLPAHVTSGGKALLAELDQAALRALYPSGPALTPDARGPELSVLRRELNAVRRRGFAVNAEQSEQGVNAIGTCVRDRDQLAVAAVVIAAPSTRVPTRGLLELAPRLAQAARDIGAALG
jgi:DNA-binding IclR family transcriptional regulator